MTCREAAPAKINLALHVIGQREDGYHLLETLVTFAHDGDAVDVSAAPEDGFSISGRFAGGLSAHATGADGNLVLKARDALRKALNASAQDAPPVHIHLEKNLPIASGIGGGSADAAAALRALLKHWRGTLPEEDLNALALQLGADVPMCLSGRPLLASGIGEEVTPAANMPPFFLVLGNPLQPVSTPEVFRALQNKNNPPIGALPRLAATTDWMHWIEALRNDLEPPARGIAKGVSELFGLMSDTGAGLVRMSGSGASCFAIYENRRQAEDALEKLQAARPEWYFMMTETVAGEEYHGGN